MAFLFWICSACFLDSPQEAGMGLVSVPINQHIRRLSLLERHSQVRTNHVPGKEIETESPASSRWKGSLHTLLFLLCPLQSWDQTPSVSSQRPPFLTYNEPSSTAPAGVPCAFLYCNPVLVCRAQLLSFRKGLRKGPGANYREAPSCLFFLALVPLVGRQSDAWGATSNPNLQVRGVIKVEQRWAVLPTGPTTLRLWEGDLVLGTQIVLFVF